MCRLAFKSFHDDFDISGGRHDCCMMNAVI